MTARDWIAQVKEAKDQLWKKERPVSQVRAHPSQVRRLHAADLVFQGLRAAARRLLAGATHADPRVLAASSRPPQLRALLAAAATATHLKWVSSFCYIKLGGNKARAKRRAWESLLGAKWGYPRVHQPFSSIFFSSLAWIMIPIAMGEYFLHCFGDFLQPMDCMM